MSPLLPIWWIIRWWWAGKSCVVCHEDGFCGPRSGTVHDNPPATSFVGVCGECLKRGLTEPELRKLRFWLRLHSRSSTEADRVVDTIRGGEVWEDSLGVRVAKPDDVKELKRWQAA